MNRWIIFLFAAMTVWPAVASADELLAAQTFFDPRERQITCRMGADVNEEQELTTWLRCWELKGSYGSFQRGEQVFEHIDSRYPGSIYSVSSSLLLSSWDAGTGKCYVAVSFGGKKPEEVLDECGRGLVEIVRGPGAEVALLLPVHNDPLQPPKGANIFCWANGALEKKASAWANRFAEVETHCWKSAKPAKGK